LAQHRPAEALTLLGHLESYARSSGLVRSLITARTLQAAALEAHGQQEQAMASLEEAVRLADPGRYRRAFLDEGPAVAALLPGVRHAAPEFVEGLLGGMPPPTSPLPGGKGSRPRRQPLLEPLSERELEVLRLIAQGLSNQEIGRRLFITVGTVKTHVHNICGKLGAGSRTQAAAQARELDLL
jgi:LuxR family maltose regulon positive regulatory protein